MSTESPAMTMKRASVNRRRFMRDAALVTGGAAFVSAIPGVLQPAAWAAANPVVETAYGKVRGFNNQGILTFRGVRYGASTAGENRFMPPQKPAPWSGVRDATSYGYRAAQTNPAARGGATPESELTQILAGSDGYRVPPPESEDCLFLNIWTPGLGPSRKRPVMVWLHGGGYSMGSSSDLLYDGTSLARRGDVVMVGVNHRLNVFGYTHFGDFGHPEFAHSNAGQLDIIAALQWIRDNIEQFGGDPKRVMIFGESGGGGKVSMLLASPPAKGLFHSAVIQSGPGVTMGERAPAARAAEMLLSELGLTPARLPEIKKLPTERILAAYFAVTAKGNAPFSPVLDPEILPAHPFEPAATRISEDVPVMIGWNRTESTVFSLSDPQVFSLDEAGMKERMEKLVGADSEALVRAYRSKFPKLTPSGIYFYASSYSMMGAGSIKIAERRSLLGKAPTFVYRLDWETPILNGKLLSPHGLEMAMVFDNVEEGGFALTGGSPEAKKLAVAMSESWISFAATGNPNSKKSGLPRWEPYNRDRRAVMIFDNKSRIEYDPQKLQREIFERAEARKNS